MDRAQHPINFGHARRPWRTLPNLCGSPSSKQCKLEDLEETIDVNKADPPQPLALICDWRQDVLLLIGPLVVGVGDCISVRRGVGFAMELMQMVNRVVPFDNLLIFRIFLSSICQLRGQRTGLLRKLIDS